MVMGDGRAIEVEGSNFRFPAKFSGTKSTNSYVEINFSPSHFYESYKLFLDSSCHEQSIDVLH
jgi:hypothetical protein